jgi:hypothetical protein
MSKILFAPFGIVGGILAGIIGKKGFDRLSRLVDDQEAPHPEHRDVAWREARSRTPARRRNLQGRNAALSIAAHARRSASSQATGPARTDPSPPRAHTPDREDKWRRRKHIGGPVMVCV